MSTSIKTIRRASMAITGVAMLGAASMAQAVVVSPIQVGFAPDITSSFISTSYNATTDLFSASGFATEYLFDDGLAAMAIGSGSYTLSASIDSSGTLSGGTIDILGDITDDATTNPTTLLTGDLTLFMPGGAGDAFEFIFDVTGGDLAGVFGPKGGTIISNPGFAGDFTSDFSNTFQSSDTAVVPVPAAAWLFISGLIGLVARGRRKA